MRQATVTEYTAVEKALVVLSWILVVTTFPFCLCWCVVVLHEFSRGVVLRLGLIREGIRGPGLVWILPCVDQLIIMDLRIIVRQFATQDLLTLDAVTISVEGVAFYYIESVIKSSMIVERVHVAVINIVQGELRGVVGSLTLHDMLESREKLSKQITKSVGDRVSNWGVVISRVDIMDIKLPEVLQRTLASEAESMREARAKIISAEGEANAATALKEASQVMATNKIVVQLRHLETLKFIAKERNLKILFPFPMEIMTPLTISSGMDRNVDESDDENRDSVRLFFSTLFSPFARGLSELSSLAVREQTDETEQRDPADDQPTELIQPELPQTAVIQPELPQTALIQPELPQKALISLSDNNIDPNNIDGKPRSARGTQTEFPLKKRS